ncbi:MAG TPA: GNAT family N-acetyltransferase [Pyrinomonadaceae bacterium]|nr:GNAT family N-acetyltransferase [Pyrinomonadaceae bacterium]
MAATLTQRDTGAARAARARELETSRLRLRPFTAEDVVPLAAVTADPDVMRYIGDGQPLTFEETARNLTTIIDTFHLRGYGRWALIEKSGGALLGYCGLARPRESPGIELVYLMARRAWGRGLATEASRACLRYGFEELGLERIYALTMPGNLRSRRVLERVGMKFLRNDRYYGYDCVCYDIVRDDWRRDASVYLLRRAAE